LNASLPRGLPPATLLCFFELQPSRVLFPLTRSDKIYIARIEYIKEATMNDFIRVMKALSDPNRLKLLKILQERVLCVCEIQAALGIAQPTVSKHLKVLENAGLVGRRKDGLWVNYNLADGSSNPYAATLLGNLKHWLKDDAEIQSLVEKIPGIHRDEICGKL
jgi:ArsR family transcriptional regulator, arsenate/arsenite/antimonite-responsive transcriptional repressor